MIYGNLIYDKIIFEFYKMFEFVGFVEMYFCILGVLCIINCYFLMRFSDSVSFTVYMNIFQNIFLTILKMSRSVNNSRTNYLFVMFCICF